MKPGTLSLLPVALLCAGMLTSGASAAEGAGERVRAAVNDVIPALMDKHGIPGMAVGVIHPAGREILTFGVASKQTGQPVTAGTLFEIGSVSKTFTATLAAYAARTGRMQLTDPVTAHVPELKGSALDQVTLLQLATHASGGMPLQFPDSVRDETAMMEFFRDWSPAAPPGSSRTYANPSIGLLGVATAEAMGGDFGELMQQTLFSPLGLENTYLDVPEGERTHYAQGYTRQGEPIRMSAGVLGREAYGVRTTVADLTRFIEANMGRIELDPDVAKAIADTQIGRYQLGPRLGSMTQALVWELYRDPVPLDDLVAGNNPKVAGALNPVQPAASPGLRPENAWINKTGSTNGFGTYVAFLPGRGLGVVLLANRFYPNDARVTAAYAILQKLEAAGAAAE